ncbi:hypothetical protein F3Y22_tig00111105pilonHSYRG00339 [Hibiscus syriacus]|uniref:Uncharacterized protein n=1 Tax=Hibiscus syriacus TaxID=106335 RepID=A0A6A2Z0T8_HIBSY|nr:hypothetical protein F3Y22_tig00111105pilonHSYRG00339 [Hibiscus syriacus]
MQHINSENLARLGSDLREELEVILDREESLWRQKSYSQWILKGDCNTSFFHASTLARRCKNKVLSLKNDDGSWTSDQEELKDLAQSYSKILFTRQSCLNSVYDVRGCFPRVGNHMFGVLSHSVSSEEIKDAIFSTGPLKASKLETLNEASFIMKLAFKLICQKDTLWVRFLRAKYKCGDGVPLSIKNQNCLKIWKEISIVWQDVCSNTVRVVGDGANVDFWRDKWIHNLEPLINYMNNDGLSSSLSATVRSMSNEECIWKWNIFEHLLPITVLLRLAAIKGPVEEAADPVWKAINNYKGLQRIKICLWLLSWGEIMTNVERLKRHFTNNGNCPCCNNDLEDVDHLFRKCSMIMPIWVTLIKDEKLEEFLSMEIKKWIHVNPKKHETSKTIPYAIEQEHEATRRCHRREVGSAVWKAPPIGLIKVNSDGSTKVNCGLASCGGVVRNSEGEWLVGFKKFLGMCSILEAEFWGIYVGLLCAWNIGLRKVIVKNDNVNVSNTLQGIKQTSISLMIVDHIKCLLDREWEVRFNHVLRSGNKVADLLAKDVSPDITETRILHYPPHEVIVLLNEKES